jgi:hypothetical protein
MMYAYPTFSGSYFLIGSGNFGYFLMETNTSLDECQGSIDDRKDSEMKKPGCVDFPAFPGSLMVSGSLILWSD